MIVVKVRLWQSGVALVHDDDQTNVRLQPVGRAVHEALGDAREGIFEAIMPVDREGAEWIIGKPVVMMKARGIVATAVISLGLWAVIVWALW